MDYTTKYRIPPSMIRGRTYFSDDDGNILNTKGYIITQKFGPHDAAGIGGSKHPHVSISGKEQDAHRLICAARWGIPRKGQQCHHLNGNIFDNRPENLIWLSVARHRHYDNRLKALKTLLGKGIYLFSRRDFIRWACMSEASFHALLAKYTTK